jgi:hypothetical protein
MTLTFEQFQATKRYGVLADLLGPHGIDVADPERGYVYADALYIGERNHPEGRWELVLGNRDWLSDDLPRLERCLYDWACAEGYVDDPDAVPSDDDE